jgi:ribosomal subunit interface protein
MRITVTARHTDIPDELKERAHEQMERAAKLAHRPHRAGVVFDADHGKKLVEVQIGMPRGVVKIASAEADDFRTALDRAVDKLRSQLDKLPERSRRQAS